MEENKVYTITLADGTVISNLTMNGNNFVSETQITSDIFEDNLFEVTISDGEYEEVHENMELVQIAQYGDDYYFVLRDLTPAEMEKLSIRADIEYIAMMAGIEL